VEAFTTRFKISVFGQKAEIVHRFLRKGKLVFVDGRLGRRDSTEREGKTQASLDVTARDVRFVGSREGGALGTIAGHVGDSCRALLSRAARAKLRMPEHWR
jgi:single-stranded DNA-binding protein